GELARRYRSLGCADREALAARLWWLAQPLLSVAGNDRRAEHFARVTMTRLMRDARTAYGIPWSWDLDELTLRYAWPAWWARPETRPGQLDAEVGVMGHEAAPGFHFIAAAPAVLVERWPVKQGTLPRSGDGHGAMGSAAREPRSHRAGHAPRRAGPVRMACCVGVGTGAPLRPAHVRPA